MSIIGSSWKEEESHEEKFAKIMGQEDQVIGRNDSELSDQIERVANSRFTSKQTRKDLMNLLSEIKSKNQ